MLRRQTPLGEAGSTRLRRIAKKWCLRFFFAGGCCFLLLCWLLGTKITAPVNRTIPLPRSNLPIVTMQLEPTTGSSSVATWWIDNPESSATVILAHPIRGDRRSMLSRAQLFYNNGYSVAMIDLQAHGETSGEHITMGHLERHDVQAAVSFVRRNNPTHRIVVLGRSLGGAAALIGSPLPIDALILESVYPTITQATFNRLARRIGPLAYIASPLLTAQLPLRLGISLDELRPIDNISQAACPVLVMSGSLDERTTAAETKALFSAAREPKKLVLFPDAAHVDLYSNAPDLYKQTVLEFLRERLPAPNGRQ